LLIERADKAGYWQSVTGSREGSETLLETARREVLEETGLDADQHVLSDWQLHNRYEIYPHWRHRYPGVTHNDEYVFGLQLQRRSRCGWQKASTCPAVAAMASGGRAGVFPSNAAAIRLLPARLGW
jgi:dATP pyrophosphohydrolase